jgi:heat shock protein HslJ
MKASAGFAFFLLFLGGLALVNLRNMGAEAESSRPTVTILTQNAWRPSHIGEMRMDETTGLYLQFETDGRLSGHGGCNRFSSSYRLDASMLSIEPLGMTRMACPPAVMSIEIAFIEALQSVATVAHRDGRIALRNADGQATTRFDAIARME